MSDSERLREVITGLVGFAATEEEVLLTAAISGDAGAEADAGDERRCHRPRILASDRARRGVSVTRTSPRCATAAS